VHESGPGTFRDIARARIDVRFRVNWTLSRRRRMTGRDPTETWADQDFRSAKALFVPSLKRGIVPLVAWT
jgi:hypothetical protein